MLDSDDKKKIPWPDKYSAEYQLRKLSDWWEKNHQLGGLPNAVFTSFIEFPHATRGARRERAQGWKWWYPNCLFSVSRGGYGCLFVYVRGDRRNHYEASLRVEEKQVKEELEIAGNLVCVVKTWQEAVDILADYLAGKMVKPEA